MNPINTTRFKNIWFQHFCFLIHIIVQPDKTKQKKASKNAVTNGDQTNGAQPETEPAPVRQAQATPTTAAPAVSNNKCAVIMSDMPRTSFLILH